MRGAKKRPREAPTTFLRKQRDKKRPGVVLKNGMVGFSCLSLLGTALGVLCFFSVAVPAVAVAVAAAGVVGVVVAAVVAVVVAVAVAVVVVDVVVVVNVVVVVVVVVAVDGGVVGVWWVVVVLMLSLLAVKVVVVLSCRCSAFSSVVHLPGRRGRLGIFTHLPRRFLVDARFVGLLQVTGFFLQLSFWRSRSQLQNAQKRRLWDTPTMGKKMISRL